MGTPAIEGVATKAEGSDGLADIDGGERKAWKPARRGGVGQCWWWTPTGVATLRAADGQTRDGAKQGGGWTSHWVEHRDRMDSDWERTNQPRTGVPKGAPTVEDMGVKPVASQAWPTSAVMHGTEGPQGPQPNADRGKITNVAEGHGAPAPNNPD